MDGWQATQLNLLESITNTTIQSILLSLAEPNRGPQTNVCEGFNQLPWQNRTKMVYQEQEGTFPQ